MSHCPPSRGARGSGRGSSEGEGGDLALFLFTLLFVCFKEHALRLELGRKTQ